MTLPTFARSSRGFDDLFRSLAMAALLSSLMIPSGCGRGPAEPQSAAAQHEQDAAGAPVHQLASASVVVPGGPAPADPAKVARARELLAKLTSPDTAGEQWDAAQRELAALGPAAADVLVRAVLGGNDMEREMSSMILALMGADVESSASQLAAALSDPSPFVRANVAATLIQFPEHSARAVPTLVGLLTTNVPELRQTAAQNLGAFDTVPPEHLPALAAVLSSETSPDVLLPVLNLLGRIGPPAQVALPGVRKLAAESTTEVAAAANQAAQLIAGIASLPGP